MLLNQNCIKSPFLKPHNLFSNSLSSFNNGRCYVFFIGKNNRTKARVLIRATADSNNGERGGGGGGGYKRIPMDTAGAYQLIDEKSGEKFIVWGGAGEDDFVTPSKDVLSWTPSLQASIAVVSDEERISRREEQGTEGVSRVTRNVAPTVRASNRLGGSFGRLKSESVRRVLARKTSPVKREDTNEYDDNLEVKKNVSNYVSNEPNADRDFALRKVRRKALGVQDSVSETTEFQEIRDIKQKSLDRDMRKLRRSHTLGVQDSISQTTEFQELRDGKQESPEPYPTNVQKYEKKRAEFDSPFPKKSSAYLSKWGDGESVRNFRTETSSSLQRMRKSSNDSGFFSRKSFTDMGCSDYMIESLRSLLFLRPSQIQAMSFPPVVEGKSCIISDQSGSGKTLAYLVPVIQRLREEELQGVSKSISQSPRVIILVPTAELATQVLSNCRAISKSGVPFRSMVVTGGFRQKTQLESLQQDLDVLIATPGRFLYLVNEGFLQLKNIRSVVLDEVDILFRDEDFDQALQRLINTSPLTTQYLFVTATLPIDAYNKLIEIFPDCEVIMGPSMHRISSGCEEVLVDCSGDGGDEKNPDTAFDNKKSALLQLVESNSVSKTIIFCNKIETCRKVENILTRYDRKGVHMRVLSFHAALTQQSRLANMSEFLTTRSGKDSQFLICTDRASRGIDFTGVDHVILFDFPRDPSEYVRRVGRTARGAGGKGKAFVFVVGKQVSLARRIMERNQKGQPLHDVPYV